MPSTNPPSRKQSPRLIRRLAATSLAATLAAWVLPAAQPSTVENHNETVVA